MIPDAFIEAAASFLNLRKCDVERVLYFGRYIITEAGFTPFHVNQIVNHKEIADAREKYENDFTAMTGLEAICSAIYSMDATNVEAPERLSEHLNIHSLYLGMLLCLGYCIVVKSENVFYNVGQFIAPTNLELVSQDKSISFIFGSHIIKEYLVRLLCDELEVISDNTKGEEKRAPWINDDDEHVLELPFWPDWAQDMENAAMQYTERCRAMIYEQTDVQRGTGESS